MRSACAILLTTLSVLSAAPWAQGAPSGGSAAEAGEEAVASDPRAGRIRFGTEVDFLPYVLQGYYGSLWLGLGHWKFRAVAASAVTPDFLIDEKFTDNRLFVLAAIADFYFKSDFKGWWIGGGGERWGADVTEKASGIRADYVGWIATLGAGYTWYFWRGLYLNPWAAFHLLAGGDRDVTVGASTFEPALFTPEASVKIGWRF